VNPRIFFLLACGWSGLLLGPVGCMHRAPQVPPPAAPAVPVSKPVQRQVTDYVDFTGRTQAVKSVNIVARATGYLIKEPFAEGSEVKAGDLLFEIDPRPYQAQYDQAVGQVNLYNAQLKLARATLARDEQLLRSTPGAVSAQQVDQDRAAVDEAIAQVKAAEASSETYKLNLSFCKVTSPIDGQVGRWYLTLGNLVTQDQTLLTTVLSLDPIYAYVDVDEPTVLRVRRAINAGQIKPYSAGHIPILMGLQGEEGFPHEGQINFVNNQVNPTTGSILARGVFDNPLPNPMPPSGGRRLILPGMFVRIRLPIGQPHPALLVIDRAILSDQDLKFVYVVDAQNNVQSRRVTTGPLQSDGLRVITEGLKPDDLVAVGALQQIRPGVPVKPEPISMLSLGGTGADGSKAGTEAPAAAGPAKTSVAPASNPAAAGKVQSSGSGNQEAPRK
jgi:multidrug efflux system membrane fusion protein